MYQPDEKDIQETESKTPAEQNVRVNGEYQYKNGYTQRIYSDAHYVREEDTTAPPRYYTPPERTVKETKTTKQKKSVGLGGVIALCLICALLGGLGGGAMVGAVMDNRVDALEQNMADLSETTKETVSAFAAQTAEAAEEAAEPVTLEAGDIYDMACQQVVGISTEVSFTGFFGLQGSSDVTGSGFIVSEDGYIITNYHVVEAAYKSNLPVTVTLHDGTGYTGAIVAVEPDNDIAVLKIDAEGLNAAVIGDSDAMRVGDAVYAIGNPLGELEFSMTTGHVSAKDRSITTEKTSTPITMFQIDAAVNSGNSGGPVYNDRGEVVGVVSAKYSDTGVEGIGFAIPINDAAAIANDLINSGYVTGKAYMGVTVNTNYSEMYARYYGWPMGAYIDSVIPGSCAEAAGIEAGDIITRLGDKEIQSFEDLKTALKNYRAGDTADMEVYHADESRTVTVTFDEAVPEDVQPAQPDTDQRRDSRPAVGQ